MPSILALRALLGASIGLGSLDLVWLNVTLAPAILDRNERAPSLAGSAVDEAPSIVVASPSPPPQVATVPAPRGGEVFFASTSAVLDEAARTRLASLVAQAGPTAALVLEGHADYQGDEAFNRTLSKQRAEAVGNQLERLGVARARIRIRYVGEAAAVTGTELWRDRRVEVQIIGGPR
ncbi:MAG: OmpA family protein [Deltaproteobacteria bacterium]|nr:OmpA family protein [Deltaproteobacteria bacterium]